MLRAARGPRLLAAGLAMALAALTAACAGPIPTAEVIKSGTLNWEWQLPSSWDPVTSTEGWDVHVLGLVYASLTSLNAKGTVQPGLATSWTYADGGKSVTFRLRPGLKFSDGTPLDAEAVKENIERGITQANSNIASELKVISGVTVDSPTAFTLKLNQVDYQVPDLLSGKDGMMVSPTAFKKSAGAVATHPVGAGPFTMTSYVPDSHADLVKNPGYWDASQIHLRDFSVQDITDPEQILAALQSGQVNVAYLQGSQVAPAKADGFKIAAIPSEVVEEIDVQTTTKPFTSPDVVKALNYAINRKALVQVQQAGYGSPAYQPFPKGFVGYDPKLADEYPYNPALAKKLLTQAGYPDGLSVKLSSDSQYDAVAEQVQAQLAQVGIKATISDVPQDTQTQYLYLDKSIPFSDDETAGRNSPVEMLDVLYSQKGLMNVDGKTAITPPAVTAALGQAQTVPLTSPRYPAALRNAVNTAVTRDPIHIWLYTAPRIFAYSPNVTGIPYDLVQQRWEGVRAGS